jgi:hypothetical protein
MTLAAGFKFEHPKAAGLSTVLLLSDSRYSYSSASGKSYRDDGKKIWALGKNVFAAIAGKVIVAQRALETVRRRLAQSRPGSFDDFKSILQSTFDATISGVDPQQPHYIIAAMSSGGSAKLIYARPEPPHYALIEREDVAIGWRHLEPILRKKIDRFAPRPGNWHPKYFMTHPDGSFRNDEDRRKQALKDAMDISLHIASQFLEVVEDPTVTGAKPPLQALLLTPGHAKDIDFYEYSGGTQLVRRTARPTEVSAEPEGDRIVELTLWPKS